MLIASLAAKHKNKPPVALSITRTTRLFFNTADAKCVDKMSVTDHTVPIATWMLTSIKGVSLDIENYCTLRLFFVLLGCGKGDRSR
ncbi:uncharacterized protein EbC_pEb10200270 (plasmid) [Erwinia billingiae Eb661]|uniref:Uncharacterized protein n=1 Tax=Erwinia billingiae (strain Eb661) TaxID=634500 RepID=D8MJC1_ERWBE|nr:uncharacterized protein EbC_pEb10200270 [Erwinia billingiae Eb661]